MNEDERYEQALIEIADLLPEGATATIERQESTGDPILAIRLSNGQWIAMQHFDGRPLHDIAPGWTWHRHSGYRIGWALAPSASACLRDALDHPGCVPEAPLSADELVLQLLSIEISRVAERVRRMECPQCKANDQARLSVLIDESVAVETRIEQTKTTTPQRRTP